MHATWGQVEDGVKEAQGFVRMDGYAVWAFQRPQHIDIGHESTSATICWQDRNHLL